MATINCSLQTRRRWWLAPMFMALRVVGAKRLAARLFPYGYLVKISVGNRPAKWKTAAELGVKVSVH